MRMLFSGLLRSGPWVLLALALLPGPPAAWADDKPITVPFELLKSQHMTIQIMVNGKGPYRVIFDTGAPFTLINNKVAKEANVFPKDFKQPFFAIFGSMGKFKIDKLQVGDLDVGGVSTMVMDHPTVGALANVVGPIEGIVGFNFFGRYRMTLDYQAKTMTFVPTNYQPQDMLENLMKIIATGQFNNEKKVLAPAGIVGMTVHKEKGDADAGVTIKKVFAASPAALAGFKEGDRLLTLDGRWTDTPLDCYAAAARLTTGKAAVAVIRRDGKEMEVQLKISPGL